MQTRRYPRTLQEAFGPYTNNQIEDPPSGGYGLWWWVSMVLIAAAAVVIIWGTR
jgi:hypothetical protein